MSILLCRILDFLSIFLIMQQIFIRMMKIGSATPWMAYRDCLRMVYLHFIKCLENLKSETENCNDLAQVVILNKEDDYFNARITLLHTMRDKNSKKGETCVNFLTKMRKPLVILFLIMYNVCRLAC